ncbi:MAG: hypothetical protein GY763_14325 [Gammaproteobacteria bacterium]|nr:hypothetical protein [Gammaproteobacteria bacterium]
MSRPKVLLPILSILLTFASFGLKAEDQVKPFMLATSSAAGFSKTLETTRAKLVTAGFEILGE